MGVHRDFNQIDVAVGDVCFSVLAHPGVPGELPFSAGARVVPSVGGRRSRGLSVAMLDLLAEPSVIEDLRQAIAAVDARARLGEHRSRELAT